jgi:hypothetical protein
VFGLKWAIEMSLLGGGPIYLSKVRSGELRFVLPAFFGRFWWPSPRVKELKAVFAAGNWLA